MKRSLFVMCIILLLGSAGFALPLTGIKTIGVDYPSLAAAISDLNDQGVGAGGVTFNLPAGYTETFGSYYDGTILTTGTLANPIIFQKTGEGVNPVITAAQSGIGYYDYIFGTFGSDYITFDAIDVQENPLNTETISRMEFGFALFLASRTDGSQLVTIKNCNISLNKADVYSVGITSHNWVLDSLGSNKQVWSLSGANSYNSFYNNHISNVYSGISLNGFASYPFPYSNYDQNNDIGSVAGNIITDFGGGTQEMNGIFTLYQNNLIIANNSITGTVSGNGRCSAIQLSTNNNLTLDLYGNYISIQYLGSGASSQFYGIFDNVGGVANNNAVNIHHNTITGCTCPNATSAYARYVYIGGIGPTFNCHHNFVTNNTYGGTGTAIGDLDYFFVSGSPDYTLGTANVYSNTVSGNVRVQSVLGNGNTTYMYINPQSITLNLYDNVVDDNTPASKGIVYGIENHTTMNLNKYIHGNTVSNIHNANGISNYGFFFDAGTNYWIYGNKLLDFTANATNSTLWGMYLGRTDPGGNAYVYNNYVGDLKTPFASSTSAIKAMYLFCYQSNVLGVYNNTIFMNAASTGTNFGTAGLYVAEYPLVVDLRNNIVDNVSTPNGTGQTVALLTSLANLNFTNLGSSSDNNCYFAGTPSANTLIFSDGTKDNQTLLDYKSRVYPKELRSVTENPPFLNSSPSKMNLHIATDVPSQCESGGVTVSTPVNIVTDYDGDARFPNSGYPDNISYPATRPDIGADEFAGIPLDLSSPIIQYHPLLNTSSSAARVLTANITDQHGVPTSGIGLPRICWKKNYNGTWTYVTGTFIGSDNYTFTFGGGGALHDTIYYFVLAQDNNVPQNIGSLPFGGAGGYTANPPAVSTPVDNAYKFVIVSGICGTFTVGTGKDYATLTAAVNDVNNKEIICPVTLLLTDAQYSTSETFPIILNPNNGSSAINTLTIRPQAGATSVIKGTSVNDGILKINGFDNLVVDGSNAGGTDMHLSLQNQSRSTGAYAIGLFCYGGYDPASNITIKNSKIKAFASVAQVTYGVLLSGNGIGYDNCVISNDSINTATIGVYFAGSTSGITHNGQITNNVIGALTSGQELTNQGVHLQYVDNTLIAGNQIMGAGAGGDSISLCGVYVSTGSTNTMIRKNKIHDWKYTREDGVGVWGISYNSDASTVTEISNNVIYNIEGPGAAPGLSPNNGYGIYVSSGGNLKILFNSIHLTGNVLSLDGMYDASSACIGIHPTSAFTGNLEIRNNILQNTQKGIGGACSRDGSAYAIMTNADASAFSVINNNDYFGDGCRGRIGGYSSSISFSTIAEWRAFTSQDVNSLNIDPMFTSLTNLVPTTTAMGNAGSYISYLPTDIIGVTRSNPPDMGAYEFATDPVVTTTAATGMTAAAATLNGSANANNFLCNVFFDYGLSSSYGTSIAGNPAIVTGTGTTSIIGSATGLQPLTTYHYRLRGVATTGLTVYGNDLTFTTIAGLPETITITSTIASDTCFNATHTITVAGSPNTFIVTATGHVTMIAGQNIIYLPGTLVQPGGYMHGYISNQYCYAADAPIAAAKSSGVENSFILNQSFFQVYPNPTTGAFTLEFTGDAESVPATVEIFGMNGIKLLTRQLNGQKRQEFSVSTFTPGIYFIHVLAGKNSKVVKLIKL